MLRREIEIAPLGLPASVDVPDGAIGVVLFAHGSGSGRFSPRNREVAAGLQAHRIGTLLFDLLTEGEAGDRRNVFDIGLLAERLAPATVHLRGLSGFQELPIGFSAPARVRRRRSKRQRHWAPRYLPSYRAAAGRTWRRKRCRS